MCTEVDTARTSSSNQCHESFTTMLPDEGVVASLLGPLSHVAAPLYMRMYLYWNVVLAGSNTVPTIIVYYDPKYQQKGAYRSMSDNRSRSAR